MNDARDRLDRATDAAMRHYPQADSAEAVAVDDGYVKVTLFRDGIYHQTVTLHPGE